MSLYFKILILSGIVPLLFSFEKKQQFYKQWKTLIPAIVAIGLIFIVMDVYFTKHQIWGFNPKYHSSITFLHLPLEEWLFFLIIPYASIFLHESIIYYFRKWEVPYKTGKVITYLLLVISMVLSVFNDSKMYTFVNFSLVTLVLLFSLFDKTRSIQKFLITFPVILIPFLLVNGFLTGCFTPEPVVWYNNDETLGIRVFTIPVEDFGFAFSLIFSSVLIKNQFLNRNYEHRKN